MFIWTDRTAAGLICLLYAGVNSQLHANFSVQQVNTAIIPGPQTNLTLLHSPHPFAVMSHAGCLRKQLSDAAAPCGARLTPGLQRKELAPSFRDCWSLMADVVVTHRLTAVSSDVLSDLMALSLAAIQKQMDSISSTNLFACLDSGNRPRCSLSAEEWWENRKRMKWTGESDVIA